MPPVDLSSLECVDEPDEVVSMTDTSLVTDANISNPHPAVNPCPAPCPVHLLPLVGPLAAAPLPPPAPPVVCQCRLNEVEHLFDYYEHHPLCDGHGEAGPARIVGEFADAGLEEGLQASLAMLALELGLPDTTMEDVVVLAATASPNHNTSIALTSLHEALQRPDAAKWTEAIHHEMDSLTYTNTFVKVNQVPPMFTPIGNNFIFSLKKDVSGKVI